MPRKLMALLVGVAVLDGAGVARTDAAALTCSQMDANAQGNMITNGSFESGLNPGGYLTLSPGSTAIKNWTVIRGGVDYYGTGWVSSNGRRSLDLNGTPGVGGVAQTFATTPGQKYRVCFDMAGHPSGLLQTMRVSAAGQSQDFTFQSGADQNHLGWQRRIWEFTANAPTTTLEFYSLQTDYEYGGPALDNVYAGRAGGPPQQYVALGDSYSSGEGAILYAWGKPVKDAAGKELSFRQGTDTQSNQCHRAQNAYPELVKRGLAISDDNFTFAACSGAIEAQFFKHWEPVYQCPSHGLGELSESPASGQSAMLSPSTGNGGQWTDPAQLDTIKSDVDLVTVTIGGNDIGFARILDGCINAPRHKRNEADCLGAADTLSSLGARLLENGDTIKLDPAKEFPGTTWQSCDHNPDCKTCPGQTIALPGLSAQDGLFKEIHRRAPKAAIRVLLYPLLFEKIHDPENAICRVGAGGLATLKGTETEKLNEIGDRLNKIIKKAIDNVKMENGELDIKVADPTATFIGHRLCNKRNGVIRSQHRGPYVSFESVGAWIHGLILQDPQVWSPSAFSFHPTAIGQEKLAQEIRKTF